MILNVTTKVTVKTKTQENRQKTANTIQEQKSVKEAGKSSQRRQEQVIVIVFPNSTKGSKREGILQIKWWKGQFSGQLHAIRQDKFHQTALHWSISQRNDTLVDKKAQENRDFTLLSLTEQTQTSQSRIATLAIRVSYEMIQGPRSTYQSLGRMKGRD
ncbi:hypothetical protein Tco_0589222 [Tanacetum coccineum]